MSERVRDLYLAGLDATALEDIRELHRQWGDVDVDEFDQLETWEALGRILAANAAARARAPQPTDYGPEA